MLSPIIAFISFLRRLWHRLTGVDINRTAASLAFTTLLGLVPLFTVAFTYVSRFPLFDRFQSALEQSDAEPVARERSAEAAQERRTEKAVRRLDRRRLGRRHADADVGALAEELGRPLQDLGTLVG